MLTRHHKDAQELISPHHDRSDESSVSVRLGAEDLEPSRLVLRVALHLLLHQPELRPRRHILAISLHFVQAANDLERFFPPSFA